jgi:hypothetical protein
MIDTQRNSVQYPHQGLTIGRDAPTRYNGLERAVGEMRCVVEVGLAARGALQQRGWGWDGLGRWLNGDVYPKLM